LSSLASTRTLYEAFNFGLSIDGGTTSGFSKVSELRTNISTTTYREAGSVLNIKDPNEVDFTDITLETGVSNDLTFYTWTTNIIQAIMGAIGGLPVQLDKRNATIYCYNRDKSIGKKIHIYDAFPVAFVAGEWDNNEDRVIIERLTLTFDYYEITT
jgi:phage tail-like protein